MSILLPALAVAFAAFCVWLGVRIMNRREGWAKRMAIALIIALPPTYLLGFGPTCWLMAPNQYYCGGAIRPRFSTPNGHVVSGFSCRTGPRCYQPLFLAASRDGRAGELLRWYAVLGNDDRVIPLFWSDSIEWIVPHP